MSRERNAVVGSGEAGGLALRGGSDARNENGLQVTRHVCGVLSNRAGLRARALPSLYLRLSRSHTDSEDLSWSRVVT